VSDEKAKTVRPTLIALGLLIGTVAQRSPAQDHVQPYLPVGVFIAPIEEGARIFTPVRLLPFDHPEALRHEFPNALQLRGSEFETLVLLGGHGGLGLAATLQRYPAQPDASWPYDGFSQPPLEALRKAAVVRRSDADAPLPGLKVVGFYNGALVAFIVDTRGLSLKARRMTRPSTMGLDITRAEFLAAVQKAAAQLSAGEGTIVVYGSNASMPPGKA
jgi:hypothetical protein